MGRWNVILSGLVPHECKPPLPILLVLEYELVAFAFVILNLPDLRRLKSYRLNFLYYIVEKTLVLSWRKTTK